MPGVPQAVSWCRSWISLEYSRDGYGLGFRENAFNIDNECHPSIAEASHFSATVGVNYQISSNVMLRPEYRYDWSGGADYDQGIFGIDLIATF